LRSAEPTEPLAGITLDLVQQRYVGRTGLRVSRLALGTMTWGRDTDRHEARDQLAAFAEAGGTMIDTAASYADGDSERLLGELIDTVAPRDELVIATKAGILRRGSTRIIDLSRRTLLNQLDESLRRLRVDHVDLWQIHAWSDAVPLDETMSALDYAVSSGRARYVGVSNFSGWQTARATTYQAGWPDRAPIASVQVEYSLLQRGIEREVLPAATTLGLGVFPWSPLGRGVLTGKYRTGTPADSRAASVHYERFVGVYLDKRGHSIVDAVCRAAEGLGLTPIEVALAWVRDRPGVTAPIVGARTAAQLSGALTSEDVVLPLEITTALDEVSAIEFGYPERT